MSIIESLIQTYDLEKDREKLVHIFREDSLFFKNLLREIFLKKIKEKFGDWIEGTTHVNNVFYRAVRAEVIFEYQEESGIQFPKLHLSEKRIWLLVLSYTTLPSLIFVLIIFNYNLVFYPEGLLLFLVCLILMPVPALITDFFVSEYFSPLDWPNVEIMNDLLIDLSNINFNDFTEKNFEKMFQELKNLRSSHAHKNPTTLK